MSEQQKEWRQKMKADARLDPNANQPSEVQRCAPPDSWHPPMIAYTQFRQPTRFCVKIRIARGVAEEHGCLAGLKRKADPSPKNFWEGEIDEEVGVLNVTERGKPKRPKKVYGEIETRDESRLTALNYFGHFSARQFIETGRPLAKCVDAKGNPVPPLAGMHIPEDLHKVKGGVSYYAAWGGKSVLQPCSCVCTCPVKCQCFCSHKNTAACARPAIGRKNKDWDEQALEDIMELGDESALIPVHRRVPVRPKDAEDAQRSQEQGGKEPQSLPFEQAQCPYDDGEEYWQGWRNLDSPRESDPPDSPRESDSPEY